MATLPRPLLPADDWDLSWRAQVAAAPWRAVFDTLNPGGGIVLDLATRYLDNFDAVFPDARGQARAVMMVRVRATPLALGDTAWSSYPIGEDATEISEGDSQQPLRHNPFTAAARAGSPMSGSTLDALRARGAIILVCDFALTHLAARLAATVGKPAAEVHAALRRSFVPGAFAVPSGMLGLALAQNSGCAFIPA